MNREGVEWLSLSKICNKFNLVPVVIAREMQAMYVPTKTIDGVVYYRALEVMQIIGDHRLCPVCLKHIAGRNDKMYCSRKCRAAGALALEQHTSLLTLGMPPIPVAITGYLMRKIRACAAAHDFTISQTIRFLITKGVGEDG